MSGTSSSDGLAGLLADEAGIFPGRFAGLRVRFAEVLGMRISHVAGSSLASSTGDLRLEIGPGLVAFVSGPWQGREQELLAWAEGLSGRIRPVSVPRGACVVTFETGFGRMSLLWEDAGTGARVLRICLPGHLLEPPAGACSRSCAAMNDLTARIASFLDGEDIRFDPSIARLDLCGGFQRRVLLAEHSIPRGMVSTYSRIARQVGVDRGARAVGAALASNPFPILIPCHRAVRSDGSPGGYQGGPGMKRALLEMEGVAFDRAGRISAAEFFC